MIQCRNLSVAFQGRTVLESIDLDIAEKIFSAISNVVFNYRNNSFRNIFSCKLIIKMLYIEYFLKQS